MIERVRRGQIQNLWTRYRIIEVTKDDEIEKWLDASSFGKRVLPDAPVYESLSKEMDALGYAMYAPKHRILGTEF